MCGVAEIYCCLAAQPLARSPPRGWRDAWQETYENDMKALPPIEPAAQGPVPASPPGNRPGASEPQSSSSSLAAGSIAGIGRLPRKGLQCACMLGFTS